jgi:NADH dehydrogenase/NADH:ubiquinone oxidoreductase subunit G
MRLKINGCEYMGIEGETIMELARRNHIEIPSLCYKEGNEGIGRCRLCQVEVKNGERTDIVTACQYPIKEGIEVQVHTEEIEKIRKDIIMMLKIRSPENKAISDLADQYDVSVDQRFISIEQSDDCILCGLCVEACSRLGTSAISMAGRGVTKHVTTPFDNPSLDCIGCGACASVCPTDAIKLREGAGQRTIWNRTFNLVQCQRCGKFYATEDELAYARKQLDGSQEANICEACRRRMTSEKMKEAFMDLK